jgi:hypothetical protein
MAKTISQKLDEAIYASGNITDPASYDAVKPLIEAAQDIAHVADRQGDLINVIIEALKNSEASRALVLAALEKGVTL